MEAALFKNLIQPTTLGRIGHSLFFLLWVPALNFNGRDPINRAEAEKDQFTATFLGYRANL